MHSLFSTIPKLSIPLTRTVQSLQGTARIFSEGWRDNRALIPIKNGYREPIPKMPPKDATHAVLLITGLFGQECAMIPLITRCAKEGIPACVFHIGRKALLPYAHTRTELCKRIKAIRTHCPRLKRLDIVAHSMGGLLAQDAIAHGALDLLEARLVTLGTMDRGIPAAILALWVPSAWHALPWNPRFGKDVTFRMDNVPHCSIVSVSDRVVPVEYALKRGATSVITVNTSHADLLRQPEAIAPAIIFLTQNIPHRPVAHELYETSL